MSNRAPRDPLVQIFWNLRRWAGYPKYALERRIDIFLSPYLAEYLTERLGTDVRLVAPEFPLKHGDTRHTVNADYLFLAKKIRTWIFLELKTDPRSVGDDQREIYRCVSARGPDDDVMARLVSDLRKVRDGSKLARKYDRVLARVAPLVQPRDRVLLGYLSPRCPEDLPDLFFPIRDLANWVTPVTRRPDALWHHVSRLLRRIEAGPPRTGTSVPWHRGRNSGGTSTITRVLRGKHGWKAVEVEYPSGCIVDPRTTQLPTGHESIERSEFEQRDAEYWAQCNRETLGACASAVVRTAAS